MPHKKEPKKIICLTMREINKSFVRREAGILDISMSRYIDELLDEVREKQCNQKECLGKKRIKK